MTVGDRIKRRRKQLKMTVDVLAEKLGKNRATIYRYESDDIDNMPISVLEPLANALKVTPGFLMGWEDCDDDVSLSSSYPYIPTSISAGLPIGVEAITLDDVQTINIPDSLMGKWANHEGVYISKVNGDSMNRIIPHGSTIVLKQTELSNLTDGDVVVYSDGGDYSVKRFYNDNHNNRLIFRPDSEVNSFTDYVVPYSEAGQIKIHGKVVLYIVELN